ncbi:uncharacterized protein LOC135081540 [Ostrinia nubilalis]|uniref:uncharacterized protein LOC135081540 n=1 Tax=Ostrinia nubilalis TaxID=29057 RepID=UPI003082483C
MWTKRLRLWRFMLCMFFAVSALTIAARADDDVPSESQCRPYIEKALKNLESGDAEPDSAEKNDSSEVSIDDDTTETQSAEDGGEAADSKEDDAPSVEVADEPYVAQGSVENLEAAADSKEDATEEKGDDSAEQQDGDSKQDDGDSKEDASADEQAAEQESGEDKEDKDETKENETNESEEVKEGEDEDDNSKEQVSDKDDDDSKEADQETTEDDKSEEASDASAEAKDGDDDDKTKEEDDGSQEKAESQEDNETTEDGADSQEVKESESKEEDDKQESAEDKDDSKEQEDDDQSAEAASEGGVDDKSEEDTKEDAKEESKEESKEEGKDDSKEESKEEEGEKSEEETVKEGESETEEAASSEAAEGQEEESEAEEEAESGTAEEKSDEEAESEAEETPEDDLLKTGEIPENLRSRQHINQILRLDEEASEAKIIVEKSADIVLRDLKKLYENSIKPLEALYKYRDLSNRHFGDPEIFSKPLVLFMGPWSGGKSSILNYLTGLEFTEWSLRTGAEPSPAYFNILMHGKNPEVLDGTQLAADWTFSGLQKFGQGLEERLRGLRYPSKILEKVNIVEIPGILEVRKQVSRVFPFNDACQWFIDRADIIFLVYDPSKLDVGPETEAILDQLKGRESQTRIVLNKADTVKPEELMRVQSALIWNISPLMSSAQPPVMYTVSLWSLPYEPGAPQRLLQAQERELLRDLRQAVDKRIENKIASARRFAVRVRNHAKMVDCYLTTYYNHKTIFGNKKLIADAIIENPQNYHIYEGLSTLTNISRYDLPDPETYRDFFRLNPLYEFQQLSATCTYFRGCPITRLDVAIAYDLPELVGKYKKMVETATPQGMPKS